MKNTLAYSMRIQLLKHRIIMIEVRKIEVILSSGYLLDSYGGILQQRSKESKTDIQILVTQFIS